MIKELQKIVEKLRKKERGVIEIGVGGGLMRCIEHDHYIDIVDVEIPEDERGKGNGIKMYGELFDYALGVGKEVWSDITVEMGAVHVWEAMRKRGYSIERNSLAKRVEIDEGEWALYVPEGEKYVYRMTGKRG